MTALTTAAAWLSMFLLLVPGLVANASADQQDMDAELEHYIEVMSADSFSAKKRAFSSLAWAGISDPRVFDPVEAELLAGYQVSDQDKGKVEQMSWLAKGLALSGNGKYQASLEKMLAGTPSKKLKKHLTTALQRLPNYEQWNPIIYAGLEQAAPGRLGQTRVQNLLNSEVPELIRAGAKMVRNQYANDDELLAAVNDSLLKNYDRNLSNKVQIDAVNHLIRTLGESGNSAYRSTLDQVAGSSNKKIAKYAVKYAGYL